VLRDEALRAVTQADTAVVFVGLSPELEGEELPVKLTGFVGGDRTDINLPASQEDLLKAVAATGKPFVVVLMTGSAIVSSQARAHARAMLEAWYPGQAGGDAIAATLAGENNPAGRLPITFYASASQLPSFHDYSMEHRTYRYFRDKPMFGFGYGLSYSTFRYSKMELSREVLASGQEIEVNLRVKNTSSIGGDEVVELYLTPPDSPTTPVRKLIGFTRMHLDAGEEKPVTFLLPSDAAMTITENGTPTLLIGRYKVFAGDAQPGDASAFAESAFEVQ
jgi:beta-glucosidase